MSSPQIGVAPCFSRCRDRCRWCHLVNRTGISENARLPDLSKQTLTGVDIRSGAPEYHSPMSGPIGYRPANGPPANFAINRNPRAGINATAANPVFPRKSCFRLPSDRCAWGRALALEASEQLSAILAPILDLPIGTECGTRPQAERQYPFGKRMSSPHEARLGCRWGYKG